MHLKADLQYKALTILLKIKALGFGKDEKGL